MASLNILYIVCLDRNIINIAYIIIKTIKKLPPFNGDSNNQQL